MQTEQIHFLTALNSLIGIGPRTFYNLKKRFGNISNVFSASMDELIGVKGIGPVLAGHIRSFDLEGFVRREERLIKEEGISVVTIEDENYPEQLKSIFFPPYVLYIMGEVKKDDFISVAVVGSRKPTNYGRITVQKLSAQLADRGVTVVSGMARGIDSLAHKSVLSAGGRTIAVLGCGIDITYPPENRGLKREIASCGAVISEFALSTKPDRMNFPRRNRIISGLSLGTLVVEAASKSGSLITAEFALEQGREVFAVPGNIGSANSKGCNTLIKMGAKLVEEVDDIIEELPSHIQEQVGPKGFHVECKSIQLSESERYIISLMKTEERHIDDLIRESNMPPGHLLNVLTRLELLGLIKQLKGKMFVWVNH